MSQQPIQTWLTDTRRLQNIISKAHYLNELSIVVRNHLAEDLANHCEVANYEVGKLKLMVTSSVWASRLRFYIPSLLKTLQKTSIFSQLQSIELSVSASYQPLVKPPTKTLALSLTSADLITMAAQSVTDANLQQALLRLAQKANKI
ncbi:MAG: RNA-binding protein [Gammaproteobacteria bacterium]|jgi:hypothetical protein|nr:RNA-binding protein [Gammaproteobacteria bacterium]